MSTGLHFVVLTNADKPGPELRKSIRSRCMLGKNQAKTFAFRKRKSKRAKNQNKPNEFPLNISTTTASLEIAPVTIRVPTPNKFGSYVSGIQLADNVDPKLVEVVVQFSSIAKQILFPLQPCIFFEHRVSSWVAPLATDPAYLHSMIFVSQFYFDAILPGKVSPVRQQSISQFLETVKLLRERLLYGTNDARLSFTTIFVVISLIGYALLVGDLEAARHHIEGLKTIIDLRGGLNSFRSNPKLLIEVLRCDIGIVLHGNYKPVFYQNSPSPLFFPPFPHLKPFLQLQEPRRHKPARTPDGVADGLVGIWNFMSDFCSVINFAAESQQLIPVETLLDAFTSTMYSLCQIKFDAGSSNEAIRLGLLAFSCSIFLHWQCLEISYSYLITAFRNCLKTLNISQIQPQMLLWVLVMRAVLVFDDSDNCWLQPTLMAQMEACGTRSWSDFNQLLKTSLWVDIVHEKPGKRLFSLIMLQADCMVSVTSSDVKATGTLFHSSLSSSR